MTQFHQPYVLPSFRDAVPESWRSNNAPKPPASSLQTVVVSSLSGEQDAGGHSDISVAVGPSSGIMSQAYLKFKLVLTTSGATDTVRFKGSQHPALSLINRYTTSINGISLDTISNFDLTSGDLITHCTSNDYIKNDLAVVMGSNVQFTAVASTITETFCIPLLGFLAGTIPTYLMNGQLNIGIDWNPVARAFYGSAAPTSYKISGVQLVYDRVSPSQEFIDAVKADLRMGNKFVIPYVNIQNVNLSVGATGAQNLSVGVNYSSLRSVLMSQFTTADLTSGTAEGLSSSFSLSQFQVSCDGRLLSAVSYDTTAAPSLCFLEAQKACGRAWDSSISDPVAYQSSAVDTSNAIVKRSYLTNNFIAGTSGMRVNEQLAFAGTPVSVLSVNWSVTGTPTCNFTLLADMQALVDDNGNVTIYR